MTYKRIDSSRRAEQISYQLRQSIFDGSYMPGQKIPSEHELSDAFGVSRIIVREAVRDLEKSGLVKVKRGAQGGAFVQEMSHRAATPILRDLLDLGNATPTSIIEVRLNMEPTVAGFAAQRATDEDLKAMRDHLNSEPDEKGNAYAKWNIDFHRLVAQASYNPVYIILVNILLDFALDMITKYIDKKKIYHDRNAHRLILEKITQSDAEGAKELFYQHLLELVPVHEIWEKKGERHTLNSF